VPLILVDEFSRGLISFERSQHPSQEVERNDGLAEVKRTVLPNNRSACDTNFPNLRRTRHSSMLNSSTSPSSSV
jgi:hypothetical protein